MAKNKWKQQAIIAPKAEEPKAEACDQVSEVEKVDFDAWYAVRARHIPKQHHKEILKADFKARGLGQCESLDNFDAALKKYGVKLS